MPEERARRLVRGLSLALVLGGLAAVLGWAIWYGVTNPLSPEGIGLYALLVLFVGFGLLGWFLHRPSAQ